MISNSLSPVKSSASHRVKSAPCCGTVLSLTLSDTKTAAPPRSLKNLLSNRSFAQCFDPDADNAAPSQARLAHAVLGVSAEIITGLAEDMLARLNSGEMEIPGREGDLFTLEEAEAASAAAIQAKIDQVTGLYAFAQFVDGDYTDVLMSNAFHYTLRSGADRMAA